MKSICFAFAWTLIPAAAVLAGDWPSWRGPEQCGYSRENAPVTQWSQDGDNLLWQVPVAGRSTPIYMDGRTFMIAPAGSGETLGERVVCLDANTGRTVWEYRFNVFHTDIVENRLGWTSVVGDPETGNIYAHSTGGMLYCLSRDGKLLWEQSLSEVFGRMSGYGGRLHTPVVDEDRVVISFTYILSIWRSGKAKAGHRYMAFDKRTGDVVWIGQPGGRPFDTTYSTPVVTVVNGRRLLVAGNADGHVYAMDARTGKKVWDFHLSDRNGLNSSVVADGKYVYAAHANENTEGTVMGRVVCIDGSGEGDITKSGEVWRADGLQVGFASPALANGRLYVATNSATLMALDARSGKKYWEHNIGRVMKGSPTVTADGVIYVGEVNGRFSILKDEGDTCKQLDIEEFTRPDGLTVEVNGSPSIGDGKVFFMTTEHAYCLAKGPSNDKVAVTIPPMPEEEPADKGRPATLLVRPAETTLYPGKTVDLTAYLYDNKGHEIGRTTARWEANGVRGQVSESGTFTAADDAAFSDGTVTATVGDVSGEARVRVVPALPVRETFDEMPLDAPPPAWVGLDINTAVVEHDGQRVLQKLAKSPSAPYSRLRSFSGPPMPTGYVVQADMMALPRAKGRPVVSDMGVINARYNLIMLAYENAVRLVTYAPIPRLQVDVPYDWKTETWYRVKLDVRLEDGKAIVRGKVWPRDQEEPSDWTVTMEDPTPNEQGSPGLYAYSKGTKPDREGSPVFFDNYQVYKND